MPRQPGRYAHDSRGADVAPDDGDDSRPSKSARKREAHVLQRLGAELVALRPEQLDAMELEPLLREAIALAQRITAREGRRRQLQYIGRLMREVDADAIRAALHEQSAGQHREVALARAAEGWRTRILTEPDGLRAFCARHDDADPASLASLAEKARDAGASRGASRALFRKVLATLRAGSQTPEATEPS